MSEEIQEPVENFEEPTTDEVDASAKADQTETPAEKAERRKYKVKIEDDELEVDDEELVRGYQKSKASTKRFQEAARLKKEAEELKAKLKENPFAALAGELDPKELREMTEKWLIEQLQDESLSPEEKELRELRRFKEEQEKLKQEMEEKRREEELSAETQKEMDRYNKEFISAIEKNSLPKSYATIKRMAYLMRESVQNGYDMDIEEAADIVKEELSTDFTQLLGSLDGEALVNFLGKDIADKIRKYDVARLKNKSTPSPKREESEPKRADKSQYVGTKGFKQLQAELRSKLHG